LILALFESNNLLVRTRKTAARLTAVRWTKPWRADGEGFIAFTQGANIMKDSPDKSGSSTNKMKLTSGIFFGCAVAAYLNEPRGQSKSYAQL
jgi:hypothetical protein